MTDLGRTLPGVTPPNGLQIRYLQTAILSLTSFLAFSLRANLSVAIVAMTGVDRVAENVTDSESSPSQYPVYDWNEEVQGLILSSFFWGYLITQLPAGIITEKYGGHHSLCAAIVVSSALTLLLPPCTYFGGWILVCANRMLQGITQGFVYPSIYTLLGQWVPPTERGFIVSITLSAHMLGTVGATPVAGYLSSYSGWPSVFYWFGGIGVVAGVVCYFLGADSPAHHRFISVQERNFIQHSLGGAKEQVTIPWKQILTSHRVWAPILTYSFQTLVFLTFLTKIPTYLTTVLKLDIQDSGVLTSLPYFMAWFNSFIFSALYDILTKRRILSATAARKTFNSFAHVTSGLCMFLIPLSNSATMSVVLLTCSVGVVSATFVGVQSNFVDLAPNYSGTLFSMANFLAASLTVTGPIVVGFIVTESGSVQQWSYVFILCGLVMILSNLIFVFFGTAETQSWNRARESREDQPDGYDYGHTEKDECIVEYVPSLGQTSTVVVYAFPQCILLMGQSPYYPISTKPQRKRKLGEPLLRNLAHKVRGGKVFFYIVGMSPKSTDIQEIAMHVRGIPPMVMFSLSLVQLWIVDVYKINE